jgi:hypothetical protein
METNQPNWKLVANLGDVNPIDYGGFFVFIDETGAYDPEAELLVSPDSDEGEWQVYRFSLPKCTFINGILSDNKFHPGHPAWFANPGAENLSGVAECCGDAVDSLITDLCSDNVSNRASAYRAIGQYHGFENLDSYPLTFKSRAEVEQRYNDPKYKAAPKSDGVTCNVCGGYVPGHATGAADICTCTPITRA